jgi:hypothetical protein
LQFLHANPAMPCKLLSKDFSFLLPVGQTEKISKFSQKSQEIVKNHKVYVICTSPFFYLWDRQTDRQTKFSKFSQNSQKIVKYHKVHVVCISPLFCLWDRQTNKIFQNLAKSPGKL